MCGHQQANVTIRTQTSSADSKLLGQPVPTSLPTATESFSGAVPPDLASMPSWGRQVPPPSVPAPSLPPFTDSSAICVKPISLQRSHTRAQLSARRALGCPGGAGWPLRSHGTPGRQSGRAGSGLGWSRRRVCWGSEQGGMGSAGSHAGKQPSLPNPRLRQRGPHSGPGQGESQLQETHQGWPG